MSKHYYAVSGHQNAETLHIFSSRQARDSFVVNADESHYTMANLQAANRAQAQKYCEYTDEQFKEVVSQWDWAQEHE